MAWKVTTEFDLAFHNPSQAPIRLVEVKTSCGCTALDRKTQFPAVVAPGAEFHIRGVIDAGVTPGQLERTVAVRDGTGREFRATLRLTVTPTYEFEPPKVSFGRQTEHDDPAAVITFTSETARLTGAVSVDADWLQATVEGNRVSVSTKMDRLTNGLNIGRVTVQTDDPWLPAFTVPVSVSMVASLILIPSRVFLVDDKPRAVRVENRARLPVRIARLDGDLDDVWFDTSEPGTLSLSVPQVERRTTRLLTVWDEQGNRAILRITRIPMTPVPRRSTIPEKGDTEP